MPGEFTFEFAAVEKRMEDFASRVPIVASRVLYQFGEEVMAASKEVVPVDSGTLMSTGYVTPSEQQGDEILVTLGYGGPAAPYAGIVHENLDPHVRWTRPGSGPKYLENPLKERQDGLPDRMAEAFKEAFG